MRVCIIRSNPIAPDPRVEKIGRVLAESGFRVRLLGWDRTGKLPREENLDGVPVVRLPIESDFGRGMGNLLYLLRWQWALWRWLLRHRAEYDLLHACDFDTILPALWMKGFHRKRVVYDIFDFYADHIRNTPILVKNIIRRIDLWAIGRADAVILVDEARLDQIAGSNPRLVTIIANSPEDMQGQLPGIYEPKPGNFCLAYIGQLQVERGLMELIAVMRAHPEWQLDLAGYGGDEAFILSAADGLPNVHWHGRVGFQQAMQLSAAADVLIATYDPSIPNHKYSSPNKIYEAMMLAKPIIVANGTNMDRVITAHECGFTVQYGDIPNLEKALLYLAENPALVQKMGVNARRTYEAKYDWKIMKGRLIQLYEKVMAK